jgi:hypothetical protein
VRPAALRQRLVDLNLALHVGPPVLTFFETPIFLPNKISRKDNNRPRVCFGFFRAATSAKVSDLNRRNVPLCDINQRPSKAFDRLRRTIATRYSSG